MSVIDPDFDDLEEDVYLQYLTEAYFELYDEGRIPYGVSTGDTQLWSEYPAVIERARLNYLTSFDDD